MFPESADLFSSVKDYYYLTPKNNKLKLQDLPLGNKNSAILMNMFVELYIRIKNNF